MSAVWVFLAGAEKWLFFSDISIYRGVFKLFERPRFSEMSKKNSHFLAPAKKTQTAADTPSSSSQGSVVYVPSSDISTIESAAFSLFRERFLNLRRLHVMKFLISVALMVVLVTTKGSTPPDRAVDKAPLNFAETMNSLKNSIALLDSQSAKLLKDQFLQLFTDKADQTVGTVGLEQPSQQQSASQDVVPATSRRERRQKRQQDQKQQTQQLRGNAAPAMQIGVGQNHQQNPQQQQQQKAKKSRPTISAAAASETRPLFVSPSNGTDILTHPIAVIKCFNQTQCIQPKLQLVKSYDAYLCKHIGQGVRFYFLGTCAHTPSRATYPVHLLLDLHSSLIHTIPPSPMILHSQRRFVAASQHPSGPHTATGPSGGVSACLLALGENRMQQTRIQGKNHHS